MTQFKMKVKGMTCTGCEHHVEKALTSAGAMQSKADFHRGEVVFHVGETTSLHALYREVREAGYVPVSIDMWEEPAEPPMGPPEYPVDYDFVIIGSGAAAFSAAIEATNYQARIAMVERGLCSLQSDAACG